LHIQLDEALLEQQRQAYAVQGVDESEPAIQLKKRKQEVINGENVRPSLWFTSVRLLMYLLRQEEGGRLVKKKTKPEKAPIERKNTAVYITNLPPTATSTEIASVFSRCGVIAEEIDSGNPRIKMYTDDKGNFKGDALVVYFRPESVALAVSLLDDSEFRLGESGGARMRVTEADYSYKKQKDPLDAKAALGSNGGSAKGGARTDAVKKKIIKKTQKLNSRLADWDDDEPQGLLPNIPPSSKWDKVVILKGMFTLQELADDPASLLDIKEDVRSECAKLGEVTNVVLYDLEEEGVVSVRFKDVDDARECVRVMDGRSFAGMKVRATISTGTERYRRSGGKAVGFDDDEDGEESKRLDQFGAWLEEEGGKEKDKVES
jgi:HIV Tat-specific factor 1